MIRIQRREIKLLQRLYSSRRTIFLIVVVVTITLILNVLIALWLRRSYDVTIPTLGTVTVTGVEAYGGDLNSINGILTVDWGETIIGTSKNCSFYLRSKSNVPVTLTFNVSDWKPTSITPFMIVSWNYTGNPIVSNEEMPIRISLKTVTSTEFFDYLITNKVTSFSFSITIKALES
jgi:hypothetical protein